MTKHYELQAARDDGLMKWKKLLENKLGFSQSEVSTPNGIDTDVFSGFISINETHEHVLKAIVKSSAQRTYLAHDDFLKKTKSKFFVINTCTNILVKNKNHRILIPPGDGIIIPGWEDFVEESHFSRASVSLIMDINSVCDTPDDISPLLWKRISSLGYGGEINKIFSNLYNDYSDRFIERNINVLKGLLALETEKYHEKNLVSPTCGLEKLPMIITFIKANIKNKDLRLSTVAEFMGISERMVQYILSENGLKFYELLINERCLYLADKIKNNLFIDVNVLIFESGFESISSACRVFKKKFNKTPKQFQTQLRA